MTEPQREAKRVKKPWPTKAAMAQVYSEYLWGGESHDFYSGEGSHLPGLVEPYVEIVSEFLTSFETPITVCDLGCGDFNVGKQLIQHTKKYVAVDIVPELIQRNKKLFEAENLEFHCLDIATDDLPAADCVILKQVLQHISNKEVHQVVKKLAGYKYVIVTEHIPDGEFEPNKDIISGQGTRLKKLSGINLTAPPFYFKAKEGKLLLSIPLEKGKGVVDTRLYHTIHKHLIRS
ncbi:MAG: class I SAM-dependent methyltransferase [Balneola sp.]|nr:MAG: class I SAM-dependent methyltransferase [Balneola sp.]